jgi:hypothetical protein
MTESNSTATDAAQTNGNHDQAATAASQADAVTREQEGQFIQESSGLERVVVPNRQSGAGNLENRDLDSIRAKNVTMDRSGAENIDAETVKMTNAGAKSIRATTIEMQNSGSMTVTGDKVTMQQSSAMLVAGQNIELSESGVFSVQAESATLHGNSRQGVLIAGKVTAEQDVRAVIGIIGKVEGSGRVNVMFDPPAAAALGAGLALVLTLIRRVFSRK